MKAEEVRIGNYYGDGERIVAMDIVYMCGGGTLIYNPILITEEWLIKFGFEGHGSYRHLHNSIDFRKDSDNNWKCSICFGSYCEDGEDLNHIKYIHQLQNLCFMLFGEELKIQ